MRVFMTKWFGRFARREGITSRSLLEAVARADQGLVDADLGGGLIKQRVARAGKGRSGGYRTIVAYRLQDRAVFLFGFAKSDRENIEPDELLFLRELAGNWLSAGLTKLREEVEIGNLQEVEDDKTT
jgi:hypothetical protein